MSTRPLPPPAVAPDDPGPWSVVSHVRQTLAHRPERRRAPTPSGLLIASPPRVPVPLAGLLPDVPVAGAGPIRLSAAAREPATLALAVEGEVVSGVSPGVIRRWRLPELRLEGEERPAEDPGLGVTPPVHPGALAEVDLADAATAPGGLVAAVTVATGRAPALALVRVSDRALVRWIAGVRAAAWTDDGGGLVLGGEWGLLLAVAAA